MNPEVTLVHLLGLNEQGKTQVGGLEALLGFLQLIRPWQGRRLNYEQKGFGYVFSHLEIRSRWQQGGSCPGQGGIHSCLLPDKTRNGVWVSGYLCQVPHNWHYLGDLTKVSHVPQRCGEKSINNLSKWTKEAWTMSISVAIKSGMKIRPSPNFLVTTRLQSQRRCKIINDIGGHLTLTSWDIEGDIIWLGYGENACPL